MPNKRAAIYIRVSSDEAKKEGYSPETQEEKLREFVVANNYELDGKRIYADLGHSGGTDKRPELQRLLKDAKNKEFDVVLVYRQDRFFRNLRLLLNTVGDLREIGIEFKSLTEPFDTTTPSGRAMFGSAGVFAEWQREVGLEARNEGMLKAMKEGKWLGGTPPYGYKFNGETQKLEIDEEEKKVVQMMFEWLVSEKLSKYKIQRRLNERKIPTKWARLKREKKVNTPGWWNPTTVERILKNEIYAGTHYYRKYKNPQGTRKELRPKEEWIKMEVPAIISKELYDKAQEQLKENQKLAPRRTKVAYAFQHKLYCGLDGFNYHCLYRAPQKLGWKEAKVYFCGGKIKSFHERLCPSQHITESRLLPTVWENFKELLSNPEVTMDKLQQYRDQGSKRKSIEAELELANNALLDCQKQEEKVIKLYRKGYMGEEKCESNLDEIKKEELSHRKEIERLSQFLLSEQEKENRASSIRELYEKLKGGIENATYEVKCQVIQKLVNKIKIAGEALEIEYKFPYKQVFQTVGVATPQFIPVLELPAYAFCDHNPRVD